MFKQNIWIGYFDIKKSNFVSIYNANNNMSSDQLKKDNISEDVITSPSPDKNTLESELIGNSDYDLGDACIIS